MGFFKRVGRQVEQLKRTATEAATGGQEYRCEACEARFRDQHDQCPACEATPLVPVDPAE